MSQLQVWFLVKRDIIMYSISLIDKLEQEMLDTFLREFNPHIDYYGSKQKTNHYEVQNKVKIEGNIGISTADVIDSDCIKKFKISIKDIPKLPKIISIVTSMIGILHLP